MKSPISQVYLWMLSALLLAGCATAPSGAIAGVKVPPDSTVAIFSTPYYPYDGFDLDGSFLDLLRKYGLAPTSKKEASFTLQIGFKQTANETVTCSLVLLHEGKSVIAVSGTSTGQANTDLNVPGGRDRETADRASAFRAAARNFEAKARGAS